MGDKAGGQAGSATCPVIFFIGVGIKAKGRSIRTVDRIVLDIVGGIVQGIRIGFHLGIQSGQVGCRCFGGLYIGSVTCRTDFAVHRAAGDQLLRTVSGCIRCRGISNLTGTNGFAPGVFIGRFIAVFSSRCPICLILQIFANIGGIDIGFLANIRLSNGCLHLSHRGHISIRGPISHIGNTAL